ncbi:uncharacterized protein LOC129616262 [Condylostylus longicornis]|uniref:uncharacterized protein LOC129616262 n=1 Tax=Condylostylus longicornis TaxID=2530218 RepID=UPI00244DAFC0|nr:uncharacterized protein LOC129616262 [Condylostylus longicornis]XP_055387795.1 uncharacterized protein LOC129616262 [Condylostylus longicornis]
MSNWKRSELSAFIALYEECENLYNYDHPDFLNKKKRLESLSYISKQLEKLNKRVTINEINMKIKTLKNQYLSVKKAESSKQSDAYVPKLWCYNQLYFLNNYLKDHSENSSPVSEKLEEKEELDEKFTGKKSESVGTLTSSVPVTSTTFNISTKLKKTSHYPGLNQKISTDFYLAEFIYSSNIPFDIIESFRFRRLIQILNKSYIIPKKKNLLTNILDEIHETCIYGLSGEEKDAILLLCGISTSKRDSKYILACIQTEDESRHFLNLWDADLQEDPLDLINDILIECQQIAKDVYNSNFYMILSDDPEIEIQPPIWHVVCNAPVVEYFIFEILEVEVVENMVKILRIIEKLAKEDVFHQNCPIILPIEKNWSTFRDTFRSYLKNYDDVQKLLKTNPDLFDSELAELIFSNEFHMKVHKNFKLLIDLSELITVSQKDQSTLAELAEAWLSLNLAPEYHEILETFRTNALTVYALAANFLHPKYKGRHLSYVQKTLVNEFMLESLNSTGQQDLHAFKENLDIFKTLNDRNVTSAKTFWNMAEKRHPILTRLAKKLLVGPASTFEQEKWFLKFVNCHGDIRSTLGIERFRKLAKIYFTFKFQDQNIKPHDRYM